MNASRLRRRLRSAVRRPARKLLTPGPPTAELLHPIGPEVPDDRHVQQVIDLCIRIGEVLLSSGEGSGETTETMLRVANAFGLSAVDVDITFTAVTICCHRGMAATPITSMRLVTHRGLDLTLLARVYRLVEQIERGRGLRPSAAALDAAVMATHPYPRWVAATGAAGLAGALALLLGAPVVAVLSAAGITAVIDVTGRFLARQRLPAFFRQVMGGFLGGRRGGRDGRRPGRGSAPPGRASAVGEGSSVGGDARRDQPAAAGTHRLPRLLRTVGRRSPRTGWSRSPWRSGWRWRQASRSGSTSPGLRRLRSPRQIRHRRVRGTNVPVDLRLAPARALIDRTGVRLSDLTEPQSGGRS